MQREEFRDFVDGIFREQAARGATLAEAEAALGRCAAYPHGDQVAVKYVRKLLRSHYREAGLIPADSEGAYEQPFEL